MNRKFKRCFAVGCLVAAGWAGSHPLNGETVEQMPRLTVRLYNYADVIHGSLAQAKATASDVFRRAGIQLVWVDCPVAPEEKESLRACYQFDGAPWAHLSILPEKMAKRRRDPSDVFGVAFGSYAFVFFHRVQELSRPHDFPETMILGQYDGARAWSRAAGTGKPLFERCHDSQPQPGRSADSAQRVFRIQRRASGADAGPPADATLRRPDMPGQGFPLLGATPGLPPAPAGAASSIAKGVSPGTGAT